MRFFWKKCIPRAAVLLGVVLLGIFMVRQKSHFMANNIRPKWIRSEAKINSYACPTVVVKWAFLANFLEYCSENGSYLRLEWSKIDTTNTVLLEKDCLGLKSLYYSLVRNFWKCRPSCCQSSNSQKIDSYSHVATVCLITLWRIEWCSVLRPDFIA